MRAPWTIAAATLLVAITGCAQVDPGSPPPLDRLYFPVSLALVETTPQSPGVLYVVNSNFDLRYNRGTVVAIDLSRLGASPNGKVAPAVDTDRGVVFIDSFGGKTALYLPAGAKGGQRTMFVPTRFDARLYTLTVDGPSVACFGLSPGVANRDCLGQGLRLVESDTVRADDPFGVALRGQDLYVTHLRGADNPPRSGKNRVSYLVKLNAELMGPPLFIPIGGPPSEAAVSTPTGLFLTGRAVEGDAQPLRSVVNDVVTDLGVTAATRIREARGVAASSDGSRLFVTTRNPDGLLVVDVGPDATTGLAHGRVLGFTALPKGVSEVGVITRAGRRDLVAVSCTTANTVALFDDELGEVAALVPGVASPYGLATGARPSGGARIYVASFASHSVDVIDVEDLTQPRRASVVGRLGGESPDAR
jgi:DNA-binding beta-propeller fold protein YncE